MLHMGNALNKDTLGRNYVVLNEGTRYSNYSGGIDETNVQSMSLDALNKSLDDIKNSLKLKTEAKEKLISGNVWNQNELLKAKENLAIAEGLKKSAQVDKTNASNEIASCKNINSTWQPNQRKRCLTKAYSWSENAYRDEVEAENLIQKRLSEIDWINKQIVSNKSEISSIEKDINKINNDISVLSNQRVSAIAVINQNTLSANIEKLKALTTQKNIALEEKKADYQHDLGKQSISVSRTIADAQTDPKIASISATLQEAKEVENTKKMALVVGVVLVIVFVGLKFIKR